MEEITIARAREMIKEVKEANTTKLFDREISSAEFCNKLENGGFSQADITLIMASVRLAGVKFKKAKEKYGKI